MLSAFRSWKANIKAVDGIATIPVHMLRELYGYWLAKKGDRKMPTRSDIIPTEISALLSRVLLIDVEYNPIRFRHRLIGTDVVKIMGRDYTGVYMDDITRTSPTLKRFHWLLSSKEPYYTTAKLDWLDREFQNYHVLSLPLGNEQGRVDMILCGIVPF